VADNLHIRDEETKILTQYLVGKKCTSEASIHYAEAVHKLNASFTTREQKTWDAMLSNRLYLKLVDSGLAISSPQSPLRKRIFIMLAILEASPDYTAYYLPQERSLFYLIPLGFRAGLSAIYLILGTMIVKTTGLK
jgi:hypothetical protein